MVKRLLAVGVLVLASLILINACGGQATSAEPVETVQQASVVETSSPAPTPTPTAKPTQEPVTPTSVPAAKSEPSGCVGRPAGVICWTEASYYVGQYVTAQGKVVKAYDSGSAVFLDFDPDYRQWLYALIWPQYKERFPGGDPVSLYQGRIIQVSGVVELYKGGPQIIVESPDQITIVE